MGLPERVLSALCQGWYLHLARVSPELGAKLPFAPLLTHGIPRGTPRSIHHQLQGPVPNPRAEILDFPLASIDFQQQQVHVLGVCRQRIPGCRRRIAWSNDNSPAAPRPQEREDKPPSAGQAPLTAFHGAYQHPNWRHPFHIQRVLLGPGFVDDLKNLVPKAMSLSFVAIAQQVSNVACERCTCGSAQHSPLCVSHHRCTEAHPKLKKEEKSSPVYSQFGLSSLEPNMTYKKGNPSKNRWCMHTHACHNLMHEHVPRHGKPTTTVKKRYEQNYKLTFDVKSPRAKRKLAFQTSFSVLGFLESVNAGKRT